MGERYKVLAKHHNSTTDQTQHIAQLEQEISDLKEQLAQQQNNANSDEIVEHPKSVMAISKLLYALLCELGLDTTAVQGKTNETIKNITGKHLKQEQTTQFIKDWLVNVNEAKIKYGKDK